MVEATSGSGSAGAPWWRLRGVTLGARLGPVDLDLGPGDTAILGHSGAGKTSLLELLVGFARPDAGVVEARLPRDGGRLPLFWAPHDALWPRLDARAHLTAVQPAVPRHTPEALLERFGLAHRAAAREHELSAGERARLTVARAVASEAAVLVLDEPFAHVDPAAQAACWHELFTLARAQGSTLVYATHDPAWVVGCAGRVVCLRQGRVIAEGDPLRLYDAPAGPEVAACFGDAAWFDPADAAAWLGDGARAGCVRPERLTVVPDADGPATVREHRAHGALMRSLLEPIAGGAPRRLAHRPGPALTIGARVRVVLLALAVALLAACAPAPQAAPSFTTLPVVLPTDGATQPAPRAVAPTRSGELLVLDTVGRVLVYDAGGKLLRQWRMPAWDVGRPEGVLELRDGRIAVADTHYRRIVFFDRDGRVLSMLGERGTGPGQFEYPVSLDEDASGNLYVAEYGGNDRVQKFAPDGSHLASFGGFGTGRGKFQRPQRVQWRDGRVYVADAMNSRIQVFADDGTYVGVLGDGLASPPAPRFPYGLWVSPAGDLWVAEYAGCRVARFAVDGRELQAFGEAGRGDGQFATPWAVTGMADGTLWVADTGNRRLVRLTPTGAPAGAAP